MLRCSRAAAGNTPKKFRRQPENTMFTLPVGLPDNVGFKQDGGGAMVSRTIMLAKLTALFAALPAAATPADYRAGVTDETALLKRSAARAEPRRDGYASCMHSILACPSLPSFGSFGMPTQPRARCWPVFARAPVILYCA